VTTPLRIGLAGLGTVGAGVAKILANQADVIGKRAGRPVVVTAVCARSKNKDRGVDLSAFEWFDDPVALATSDAIDVFVELVGGSEGPANDAVTAALKAGKHVVTANKALVALHGARLAPLAEDAKVALNYEAAVAGGIPVIKAIREGLAGNEISRVSGILNGTCNYILTEMEATGRAFGDVLADAQKLGYAEADPSFDVGGIDAAHKLAILASLAFGVTLDFDGLYVEGIEAISAADIDFAKELGYKIRLLGIAARHGEGIEQRVHPVLVPISSPLAAVTSVVNAVAIEGSAVGTVVLEGPGAGEGPTASAVVGDIIDIARGLVVAPFGIPSKDLQPSVITPICERVGSYYLRINATDRAGSMAEITKALAEASVSIERIIQSSEPAEAGRLPVVIITHDTQEKAIENALKLLNEHDDVLGQPMLIRVERD